MSWDPSALHSAWTVIAFTAFLAIVVWAWSGTRRQHFEEAARIPLEDGSEPDYVQPDQERS